MSDSEHYESVLKALQPGTLITFNSNVDGTVDIPTLIVDRVDDENGVVHLTAKNGQGYDIKINPSWTDSILLKERDETGEVSNEEMIYTIEILGIDE